jgi:catechol 2,3-dioxygenase-like lactoylglutathione lyase family enzyme
MSSPPDYTSIRRNEVLPEPKIRTCGIDHVVLHVADYEMSRAFYMSLLGFTPFFECEGHGFFRSGDCQIGLFEARGESVVSYAEMDHLALRCDVSNAELLRILAEAGIERLKRPEGLGWPATKLEGVYFKDPDGHVLQLLAKGQWPQVERAGGHAEPRKKPVGWGHE